MDPMLLQKQVRDNAEDIKTYLEDLKNWTSEMKRNESLLSQNKTDSPELPSVRKKVRTSRKVHKETVEKNKLSSCDYSSWEKFDVEKACADIDVESSSDESDIGLSEEAALREEAQYEKERGNSFVKSQKWKEAIECYSRAIECFSYDPVFFANRALCFIHTKEYSKVESDCTSALTLDNTYVKAYHRRATARTHLGNLLGAKADLEEVLKLEPKNTASKAELLKVQKRLDSAKKTSEQLVKEKPQQKVVSDSPPKQQDIPAIPADGTHTSNDNKKIDGEHIVQPIVKPPHLRSKKPLKRIEIREVNYCEKIVDVEKKIMKDDTVPEKQPSSEILLDEKINTCNERNADKNVISESNEAKDVLSDAEIVSEGTKRASFSNNKSCEVSNLLTTRENIAEDRSKVSNKAKLPSSDNTIPVPPVPTSSVDFLIGWNKTKCDPHIRFLYLKQISPERLPKLFQDSLEASVMSEFITVLATKFYEEKCPVYEYLYHLSNVRRFRALHMFLSKEDRAALKKLFDYCEAQKECIAEDLQNIKKKYEI